MKFIIIKKQVDLGCGQYFDTYSFEFGIRTVKWSLTTNNNYGWLINDEPFYCMGVNRHEDFPVSFNFNSIYRVYHIGHLSFMIK